MKARVHTEKHIGQFALSAIAAGAASGVELIKAVAVANKNLVKEVTEGSIVSAIFVECWIRSQLDAGQGNVVLIVEKTERDSTGATFAELIALNDYPNKKNILYTREGLTPSETLTMPVQFGPGWLKIPKGKQRFGLGDSLHLRIASQTEGVLFCGFNLYKEQS